MLLQRGTQNVYQIGAAIEVTQTLLLDPYGDYLVYDSYTDDNATDLPDHTPEKDAVGNGYTDEDDWTINGNVLEITAGTKFAWIDSGKTDVAAQVELMADGEANDAGPMCRITDAENGWLIALSISNDVIRLYKHENDGYSDQGSAAVSVEASVYYTLKITASGNDIGAWFEGAEKVTVADAFNNTQTNIGYYSGYSATVKVSLNDLTVVEI